MSKDWIITYKSEGRRASRLAFVRAKWRWLAKFRARFVMLGIRPWIISIEDNHRNFY